MAEFLDVRNPDGTVTGETVEKKLAHATGVLHGASHIWIWRVKDGKLEIMLQHRAPTKSSFPDCFDLSAAGHLTAGESVHVAAPLIEESPVNIECRVKQILELGSHHMFVAEVVGVDVDEQYLDEKGKFHLDKAEPIVYSHGSYVATGETIGTFGFSVKKK